MTTPQPEPRKTVRLTVRRFSESLYKALQIEAVERDMTVAQVLEEAVRQHLAHT